VSVGESTDSIRTVIEIGIEIAVAIAAVVDATQQTGVEARAHVVDAFQLGHAQRQRIVGEISI
jgi:hypothetical protein